MGKGVTDLTTDELERLAAEAWFEAAASALKAGVPVVGRDPKLGTLVKRYPDGRTEVLLDIPQAGTVRKSTKEKIAVSD
jgi:hypothetical protein